MKQRCLPRHTFAVSHSQAADREQSLLCCNHLLSPPEPRQGLGLSLAQCSCFGADVPLDPNKNPVLLLRYGQHCSVFKTQILMGNCSSLFLTRGNMAQLVVISDKFGDFSSDSFQAMPLMEGNIVCLPPVPRGFPAEVSQQESNHQTCHPAGAKERGKRHRGCRSRVRWFKGCGAATPGSPRNPTELWTAE